MGANEGRRHLDDGITALPAAPTPEHVHEYDHETPLLGASGQRYVGCACGHRVPATTVPTTAPPKICVRCDGPLTESVMRGEYFCTTNGKCPLFYKEQLGKDASPALKTPELTALLDALVKEAVDHGARVTPGDLLLSRARAAIEAHVGRLERELDSAKRRIVADNDERIRLVALGSRLEGERDAALSNCIERMAECAILKQQRDGARDTVATLEARVAALTEALQKISGLNPREDDTELTAIVRAALSPTGGANDGG